MQIRILKHCKIKSEPQNPGTVIDVPEERAKALIDNGYAEAAAEELLEEDLSGEETEAEERTS